MFRIKSSHAKANFRLLLIFSALLVLSSCGKQVAPNVSFTDLNGNKIHLEQLRGKIVMVNFWATSCAFCVGEMPEMVKTYEKYHAQGLEFIAVAMSYDPPDYVLNFAESRKLPFNVTLDVDGKLAHSFGDVQNTPTTFVIDRHGNIIKKYVGAPDFTKLHQLLDSQPGA